MKAKNYIIYQFSHPLLLSVLEIEQKLKNREFSEISENGFSSSGFVSPLPLSESDDSSPLLALIDSRWYFKIREDTRKVKPAAVTRLLNEKVELIEKTEARKVLRKEVSVIKDEIVMDLLPKQVPETSFLSGFISPKTGLIFIEASSYPAAEKMLSELRFVLGSLPVKTIVLNNQVNRGLTEGLLSGDGFDGFGIGESAEFSDLEKSYPQRIKIKDSDPCSKQAVAYLDNGLSCMGLSLTSKEPEGVSFYLVDSLQLKKVIFSEALMAERLHENDEGEYCKRLEFKADSMLIGSTLELVWSSLVNNFGGYDESPATW